MAETFVVNENDFEYRFGDSGPKYLMKGPRMNFALVQFQPGQNFQAHHHNIMEENFFVLEGKVDIVVDGVCHTLEAGDFIRQTAAERGSGVASQRHKRLRAQRCGESFCAISDNRRRCRRHLDFCGLRQGFGHRRYGYGGFGGQCDLRRFLEIRREGRHSA